MLAGSACEAAFAALAGVGPLQASSSRVTRHRLNRFGDRQLNRALHVIVAWQMVHRHPPTQAYLTRRRAQQLSDAEIRRCLKRYAARRLFRLMEASAATRQAIEESTGTRHTGPSSWS
jgi:transposase